MLPWELMIMNEYVGKHVCIFNLHVYSIQHFLQLKIKFLCFRKKTSQSHLNQIATWKIDKTIKILKFYKDHPPKISLNHFYFEG